MGSRLDMLWLEITGRCQLQCVHCYADSGPDGDHGAMATADWARLLHEAADLGVKLVQFIGGEPTLYPDLTDLIDLGLRLDLQVEVYSNLVHVTEDLWRVFERPGVRLATSYYSDDPAEHQQITGRPTLVRTRENIAEALRRQIPVRAGMVQVLERQRISGGAAQLTELGVPQIRVDRMRRIGRPVGGGGNAAELCGRCGDHRAAVLSDGSVTPCIMARSLVIGNVQTTPLAELLGQPLHEATREIPAPAAIDCDPQTCMPAGDGSCEPNCTPGCDPGGEVCGPNDPTCGPSS